ncbi:MAG: hypothetical protein RLZ70_1083, partial [Verrucomicrobiota bacterium]
MRDGRKRGFSEKMSAAEGREGT